MSADHPGHRARAASLTGAFWGFIPGFLKARTGASEVITTIMLNYVAAQVVLFGLRSDFLRQDGLGPADLEGPLGLRAHPADPRPAGDPPPLGLRRRAASWPWSCPGSCSGRRKGFELRAAGFNMTAARYAGMSASGSIILAMVAVGRAGRPRRLDGGPRDRAPDVQRHQRGLRLQRDRPRPAGGQPAAAASWSRHCCSARCAPAAA